MLVGSSICAAVAGPLSPEYPRLPIPATRTSDDADVRGQKATTATTINRTVSATAMAARGIDGTRTTTKGRSSEAATDAAVAVGGAVAERAVTDGPSRAVAPARCAATHAATCAREWKPSLLRICSTCPSAVRSEITRRSAISRLENPWATRSATSRSRGLNAISTVDILDGPPSKYPRERSGSEVRYLRAQFSRCQGARRRRRWPPSTLAKEER